MILIGAAAAIGLSGCYVYTDPAPVVRTDVAYEPVYYNNNVVYYDDVGAPYVVVDGAVSYIPTTYVRYGFYVNHYHRYGPSYRTWVRSHGPVHRHRGPVRTRHHRR